MITEEILKPIITDINPNNYTISIAKDTIIKKDGLEIARSRNRCAFYPGDIEKIKIFIDSENSPEITYLQSLWTQEVIDNYLNQE